MSKSVDSKVGVLMLRVPVQLLTGEGEGVDKFKAMGDHVIQQAHKACAENGLSLVVVPASTDSYGNHLYDLKEC